MLKQIRPLYLSTVIGFVTLALVAGCNARAASPVVVQPTPAAIMAIAAQPTAMALQPTPVQDKIKDPVSAVQTGQDIPRSSQQRVVLKNATLNMTVDDPARSASAITQMAEQMGGWVVASNSTTTERGGQRLAQATISVRVPAEQFSSALERVKAGAVSIETENITGDDVTQKYVDLSSQLSNLEATEAQFQKIMSTTTNINDVLTVQKQLTEVQGQIEGIKGQLKYFSEAAAYSLISLTLTQKAPPPPTPQPQPPVPTPAPKPLGLDNWQPAQIVLNAADTVVSAAQIALSILIWLIVVGGPVVIPMVIAVYLLRRFRPRPTAKQPQVQAD
jgi:hypothetical protein